jgi:hypothetical protein
LIWIYLNLFELIYLLTSLAETLSDAQEDLLRQRIADEIGSKTLQLSPGWGTTLFGLSFEESGLANTLISTLKRNGYEPSYIRLMRKEMANYVVH